MLDLNNSVLRGSFFAACLHNIHNIPHLPDLDKLAAGADSDHVAVVGHPDLVHVLVVIFMTSSVAPSANLKQEDVNEYYSSPNTLYLIGL